MWYSPKIFLQSDNAVHVQQTLEQHKEVNMEDFQKERCDRGYHVYKQVWKAILREELVWAKEYEHLTIGTLFVVVNIFPLSNISCF